MSILRAVRAIVVTCAAVLVGTVALTNVASAHGSVVDPAARAYACLERWGHNHLAPEMATEDPMCYQAWQANPNAMWNWNGLYRENLRGNYQAAIPDGTLCSGGNAEGGRYDALDAIGPWIATPVSNNFTLRLFDQASHGADYIRVYVTRQGFDALNQPLRWSDLELRAEIGYTPASQWRQVPSGVEIDIPVSAPGRTGRHIVYTIWLASHMDQAYFLCSDVTFGGGNGQPTPPPSTPSPTPPPSTPTPPPGSEEFSLAAHRDLHRGELVDRWLPGGGAGDRWLLTDQRLASHDELPRRPDDSAVLEREHQLQRVRLRG